MPPRRPFARHAPPEPAPPPARAHRDGSGRSSTGYAPTSTARACRPRGPRSRKGLGFSTPSSAEDHLQALARKGAIELRAGTSRGLRLRDLPGVPVQGTLPLVGRVAAGSPILATGHIEGRYRIDPALFAPAADYLLRVRGDSMIEAGIHDGDLLAVHRADEARSGQIVVARLGGAGGDEVTVKRLKRRGRTILLVAENPAYAPIEVDPQATPLTIEGIGVGVIRTRF